MTRVSQARVWGTTKGWIVEVTWVRNPRAPPLFATFEVDAIQSCYFENLGVE